MALLSGSDSAELLDLLFDQNSGILTNDSYLTKSVGDHHQYPEQFNSEEFGLTDREANELLNCLTGVDLNGILQNDFTESYSTDLLDITATPSNHCLEDHIYSRSPDENTCSTTSLDIAIESPSNVSAVSCYSYSDTNSPTGVTVSDEYYSSSPLSNGNDSTCQHSPLNGNMEDMMIGTRMGCNTVFVLQDGQLIEAVTTTGLDDGIVDDSNLVSLDMVETDVESYSDDGSMEDQSLFNLKTGSELPFTLHDIDSHSKKKHSCERLILSEEEKLLLSREGITIPTDVPLTKEEERALKSVRRKIRNKVSAKVSRKRKQEYVDGLEKRVKICTIQNRQLQQKVEKLEKLNQSFVMQLKKLQAVIAVPSGINVKHAQTGTCIMVLVLSFAFFVLPNVGPWLKNDVKLSAPIAPGRSRSLLTQDPMLFSEPPGTFSDEEPPDHHTDQLPVPNFSPAVKNPLLPQSSPNDIALPNDIDANANKSFVVDGSEVIETDLLQKQGTAGGPLAVADTEELSETPVDVTQFPPKNDL